MAAPVPSADPVLLFDGECGLCRRVVGMLLRLDRTGRLRFAPLQSSAGHDFLRAHGLPTADFDTLVFAPDWAAGARGGYLLRSRGALAALRVTGPTGRWLAALLAIIPERWRDALYRVIGHWRYRLFGPWRPRPLAQTEWQRRFVS